VLVVSKKLRGNYTIASTVPQSLIAEFEAGISSKQETLSTEPKYGVITLTLFTSAEPMHGDEPPEKRKKVATTNMEKGYVSCCVCSMYMSNNHFNIFFRVFTDSDDGGEPLTCNTEKDKSFHLHRRTAGEYRCLLRRYCVIGVQLLV